jgi:hypothetical protein
LVKVIHSIETKSDKIGNVKNHQQKNVVNDQIFCGTFIVGKSEIVCLDYTNDLSNPGNSKSTLNTDTVKGSPHLLMV